MNWHKWLRAAKLVALSFLLPPLVGCAGLLFHTLDASLRDLEDRAGCRLGCLSAADKEKCVRDCLLERFWSGPERAEKKRKEKEEE